MVVALNMTVVQRLSEEQIVIRPQRIVVLHNILCLLIDVLPLVHALGDDTVGIVEVTIGITVLNVSELREVGTVLAVLLHKRRRSVAIGGIDSGFLDKVAV